MRYYKSAIQMKDGQKKYGNLPPDFVLGYESEGEAYFELDEQVQIPVNVDITEITLEEFTKVVQLITDQDSQKRQQDETNFIQHLKQKDEEIKQLKERIADLYELQLFGGAS